MKWIWCIYGLVALWASEVVSSQSFKKEDGSHLGNRIQRDVNVTNVRQKRQSDSDRAWNDLVLCQLEDGTCYQNKECTSQYWGASKDQWTECRCSAGFTKRPYFCKQAPLCEIKIQRWGCHWMLMCEILVDMSIREAWRYERHGQCTLSIFTVIGLIVGNILIIALIIGGFFFYQRRKQQSVTSMSRKSSLQSLPLPLKDDRLLSLQRTSSRCASPAPSSVISAHFNGVQKSPPAPKRSFTPLHKNGSSKPPSRNSFSRPTSPNSSVLSGYSRVNSPLNNTTNSIISNPSAISELERPMRSGSRSENY